MAVHETVSYQAANLEEIAKLLEEEAKAFEVKDINLNYVRGREEEKVQARLEHEYAKGLRRAVAVLRATTLNPSSTRLNPADEQAPKERP